ncbi:MULTISPECIES: septal ring lytic transglycosylase RlpA family protein [Halomonadaceae]|uniref:septal ring lytic transglycosylase RlpA family protein n=1 Tax=Halomonadaceae TaxID=28256 RepID=UPI001B8D3B25|nr:MULTISPECIES: septal ring lytic transglycosylase RlpA family protein [Halomonas]MBS3669156.1 septal ring lytic transglycosylase RlpA family protein [Halomonas boliviensis]MCA8864446.1 septal ring lytic transglycosylase RlpA family protein [Halomonas sp. SBBP1]UZH08222.1 septal ring lytic transglycosylase RlpA family protein [Halomonas sp. BDJS001]
MKSKLTMARRAGSTIALLALVAGCASNETQRVDAPGSSKPSAAPASSAASNSSGRYAMSGDAYPLEPPDVTKVPDAEPRIEQPSRSGNRPSYEVWGKTYHVLPDATGYEKRGTASWYGEKFHGYATSNGEIYDMYKMSAAHRSLPLPTFARVTSLDNGRSVIVRVNDRGPFHSDREIDLSYAAAARLGFLDNGTGSVKVEAINPEQWLAEHGRGGSSASPQSRVSEAPQEVASDAASMPVQPTASASSMTPSPQVQTPQAPSEGEADDAVYLQIAALGNPEGAQQLQQRLQGEQPHAVRIMSDDDVYRVQVGPIAQGQELQARETLRQAGFPQVFVVR